MKWIVIDSSATPWGLSCVTLNEQHEVTVCSSWISEQPRALSQQIFGALQHSLDAAHWTLGDVDAIAVAVGPGSWTGLRIGLSAAKTLAQARQLPLVGVRSFDAVAQSVLCEHVGESTLLLVAAPCRPGEIYAKIYTSEEHGFAVVRSEWIASPENVTEILMNESQVRGMETRCILTGDAASTVAKQLEASGQEYSLAGRCFENVLAQLAVIGAAKLATEGAKDTLGLVPLYLAPSNAERNLLTR